MYLGLGVSRLCKVSDVTSPCRFELVYGGAVGTEPKYNRVLLASESRKTKIQIVDSLDGIMCDCV